MLRERVSPEEFIAPLQHIKAQLSDGTLRL